MKNPQRAKKNPDVVTRVFDGETILIPLYSSPKEDDSIYVLDDVSSRIWELINGKRGTEEIEELLLEEFEVAPQELHQALSRFMHDLRKIKAVI